MNERPENTAAATEVDKSGAEFLSRQAGLAGPSVLKRVRPLGRARSS